MDVTVYVSSNDIETGLRDNKSSCPVALALSRSGFKRIRVERGHIVAFKRKEKFVAEMPRDLMVDLWDYDCGGKMTPRGFDLHFDKR